MHGVARHLPPGQLLFTRQAGVTDERNPAPRDASDPAAGREIPRGTDEESESSQRVRQPRETPERSTHPHDDPDSTHD
jgi:hypothetical protein